MLHKQTVKITFVTILHIEQMSLLSNMSLKCILQLWDNLAKRAFSALNKQ